MQAYQLGQRFTTAGLPLNGGKAYFYLTTTTTLEDVFEDDALATPLANPVVADSAGFFPELVYLDPTKEYRCVIKTAAGATLADADPINTPSGGSGIETADIEDGAVTGPKLADGAIEVKLGYTPLNAAGDTITGGKLTLDGAETTYASLNIPDATADPTSPVNGDIWHEANLLKARLNGVTETVATASSVTAAVAAKTLASLGIYNGYATLSGSTLTDRFSNGFSIARTGVGAFTITLDVAASSANSWAAVIMVGNTPSGGAALAQVAVEVGKTASTLDFATRQGNTNDNIEPYALNIMIFVNS